MISRLCLFFLFLFAVETTKCQDIICVIPSEPFNSSSNGSASGLSQACAGLEVDNNLVQTGTQIDGALVKLSENRNNTKLTLLPGVHQISTSIYLELLSNVSISGQGAVEDVEIACAPDVGLAIVNSQNLVIKNVTIAGCGLRGEHLARISMVAQEYVVLNTTYTLLPNIARAVVIVHCHSLTLENVHIRDTVGVGLTGLNVLGDSLLKNVEFFNNSGSVEITPYEDTAGGAVFFFGGSLTPDTLISGGNALRIDHCRFRNSSSRSKVNRYILADDFFEITDFRAALNNSYAYPLDGAAGLSLIFSQQFTESQVVMITATSFAHMTHPEGGCMLVLFQEPLSTVSVILDGAIFENCHGNESGGGLLVGFGYPTNYDAMDFSDSVMPNSTNQTIMVKNTEFRECNASWGGGTAVLSVPTFLTRLNRLKNVKYASFENCTWIRNRGITGSALAIWEGKYHGIQKKFGFEVNLRNCNFIENGIEEIEDAQQLNAAVVNLDAVEVSFHGSTNFVDNRMSCIGATRSIINIEGTFKAERTQVISSGALDFRDTSFLVIREGAIVQFFNNQAVWRGGAIFVSASTPWPLTEFGLCSLHFDRFQACPQQPCYTLSGNDTPFYRVDLVNNSAGMVGNALYGTTFHQCPWVKPGQNGNEILTYLENELSDILHFSVNLTDQESHNTINSLSTHVGFNSLTPLPQQVMPGEQWTARITATDFYNQKVPLLTTLRLLESDSIKDFSINGNAVAFIDEDDEVIFEFFGREGQTITFQFLPIISFRPSKDFSFTFMDCKVGFIYNTTRRACICDELLLSLHPSIQCNPNGTISYGPQRWIGFRNNTLENKVQYPYLYTTALCIFDYCNESTVLIQNLSDNSEQCNHNRAGSLCGRCREGYSRVLGSTACEKCHNYTLWYLILYFASGFLVVTFIFTFQISISSGYFNGPIFYANIVSIFAASIYPINVPRYQNVPFVIISFLNLDIGFQTCFYDGMTQLVYTGLKLSYPFYLLLIISSIALVAKFCPGKLLKMKSLKPVRAIATILFLSFTNIFQSVTRILSFAVLTYRGQNTEFAEFLWLHDPSVRYGSGGHGALVALSWLLFIFILLPQVLLLTFYKPLQKIKCINKRLQKWWPFFDAFQNPFVGHLRFWIGIQLLIRGLILIISCFQQLPSTSSITLREYSLFIVILILITFTILQAFLRPYKGWLRNILDLMFLLDLIYLLSTALYYNILRVSNQNEVERIQNLHFKFVQFCQVTAVTLATFIFAGFIFTRAGIIRYCFMNLLPKMPPKLQSTVIAALKDSGYKPGVNTEAGRNKPIRLLIKNPSSTSTTLVLDSVSGSSLDLHTEYTRYRESILEQESIIS